MSDETTPEISERDRIEGSVARILNARELVINRGSNSGVEIGTRFVVLNANSGEIEDPETGESLGPIDIPKVLVKVTRVENRLSVASTFVERTTRGGPLYSVLTATDLYAKPQRYVETLRTDSRTYKQELSDEDSYVHVGDPVREYKDGDFSGW